MKNYNYADEIIKDDDMQPQNYSGKSAPRKNILNSQDQDITVNDTDVSEDVNDVNNDPEEKIKSFEEGIKNDNSNTEDSSAST
ncbi:MAG: hypothetical protein H7320_21815 [Ferruginibacter sp.]|nr:hypothetical protein [Ferruginibacter sp.]